MTDPTEVEGLEHHRVRMRLSGLPVYEDDELIGVRHENPWSWADLTAAQKRHVEQVGEMFRVGRDTLGPDEAFNLALGEYGVSCPHRWRYDEPYYRECQVCRVLEAPLPGRVVDIGGEPVRVPDPPPPVWRVPRSVEPILGETDPLDTADLPCDEYRWNGHRYEIASR